MSPLHLVTIIIATYLAIGIQYSALTPRWQVPDEPAHYNYIRYLAERRTLPVLDPGEYNQSYITQLTRNNFPPDLPVDSLQYESWQPPLYYLLALPLYALFGGAVLPLRLFSLLLGAGVIVFAYLAIRETVGANYESPVPILAAGFIAFIPQHVAMMAGINNDSLSELLIAIGLWLILRLNNGKEKNGEQWALAAVIAAALVTKSLAYILVPLAGVLLLLKWRRAGWNAAPQIVRQGLVLFIPALAVGGLWWGHNIAVYGWPDFMASQRHAQVVVGQPRTAEWVAQFGAAEVARRFVVTTFHSFWGQFGWMGVVMDSRVYWALATFSMALVIGGVFAVIRHSSFVTSRRDGLILLLVSALLTLSLYLYYNLSFVQHQGRYLFPALIPLGLGAAVGLAQWGRWLSQAARRNVGWATGAVALCAMAALDVAALYRFILPALR
ncbi:MAG: glycosyltransferase family 39 protein [Chloroflexi bacterium]|nr:glycosyltransferase family 39 protein [Chloroflexota bacterium]